MNYADKIKEETNNVEIEIKDIADWEWGGTPFIGYEFYKKLVIKFPTNNDLLHTTLAFTEDLSEKFCEEINAIWEDDRNPYYKVDLTGFWLEFPKDWMDEDLKEYDEFTLNIIKKIAIKYYLIAKYDKPSYIRKGFDIYEFLEEVEL